MIDNDASANPNEDDQNFEGEMDRVVHVKGMYNEYFLDYASYVILERAVPHQYDGLKPVQRLSLIHI